MEVEKERIIEKIRAYLISKNIKKASLFGSFIREDFKEKSDIDILIEPYDGMTLFDLIRLQNGLKRKIKRRIDLCEYDGLRPIISEEIIKSSLQII